MTGGSIVFRAWEIISLRIVPNIKVETIKSIILTFSNNASTQFTFAIFLKNYI